MYIFKKLFLALLLAGLTSSNAWTMQNDGSASPSSTTSEVTSRKRLHEAGDEPKEKKQKNNPEEPTQQSDTSTTATTSTTTTTESATSTETENADADDHAGDNPASAADNAGGSVCEHKRSHDEISPEETQEHPESTLCELETSESDRPFFKRTRLFLSFLPTQVDNALLKCIPGYRLVRNKCCDLMWPHDFLSLSDNIILNFIFPTIVEYTSDKCVTCNAGRICKEYKHLTDLRLVCKRFNSLLTNANIRQILSSAGIDLKTLNNREANGSAPLNIAILKDLPTSLSGIILKGHKHTQYITVQILLNLGADPNIQTETRCTLLKSVISSNIPNKITIFRALLHAGTDPNGKDYSVGMCPLEIAILWPQRNTLSLHYRGPLQYEKTDLQIIQFFLNIPNIRVPEYLLQTLSELGFTNIPEEKIDRTK